MTTTPDDFDVTDHGSIIILRPLTADGRYWIDDNLPGDTPWFARGAAIERRYFEAIYDGIIADGLTIS